jgi:3-phosphoshikimate 1-carboxyvinyltransferase
MASAQVKSALLLAGLYAQGSTRITEPVRSRDHTERFLRYFGAEIDVRGNAVTLAGGQKLSSREFAVAGDISSAAFFIALSLLVPGSHVRFRSVLDNPTRSGILQVLERAGVPDLGIGSGGFFAGPEPVSDFSLAARRLKAFDIRKQELPMLIDEIPVLCVLATQAEGESVIHDADELRVKESDRIESIKNLLLPMGADIRSLGNSIYVKGPTKLKGASVDSKKDHRIAMSGIVAGLIAEGETTVEDIECIDTSFPGFFERLKSLNVRFELGN